MIEKLAEEEHASDWGMRIISSHSPMYGPEGYHFGSVWPLFTGWASVGEYRYHAARPAIANLQANAWLALDGAGGNATEVLSGMTYSPLSTASPHQIWSAAMVVSPLLRGLCGLDVDAINKLVAFAPHLPADWEYLGIHAVSIGAARADVLLDRDDQSMRLRVVNHGTDAFTLDFAPAYSPFTKLIRAKFDGQNVRWTEDRRSHRLSSTFQAADHTRRKHHGHRASRNFRIRCSVRPAGIGRSKLQLEGDLGALVGQWHYAWSWHSRAAPGTAIF